MTRGAAGAALLFLVLGACGSKPREPTEPIDSVQLNAIASSGPTIAEVLAKGNDATPAATTPVEFDYKGVWATNANLCTRNHWRFTATEAVVGSESRCTIERGEARTPSEVKLTVTCTPPAGGIKTQERWSLVHRNDGGMIVARTAGNRVPVSTDVGEVRVGARPWQREADGPGL